MSIAEVIFPFIPVNPVIYTKLAAIDQDFYNVYTSNKVWSKLNVYGIDTETDKSSIFKHFITSITDSDPQKTISLRNHMCFVWQPDRHNPSPYSELNYYAMLGRWQPQFYNEFQSLGFCCHSVSKQFVLFSVNFQGLPKFAFERGMPLSLYKDQQVFDAAISYCGCAIKEFKYFKSQAEKALTRGCSRKSSACFENPLLFIDWSNHSTSMVKDAIRSGMISFFEMPFNHDATVWRHYLEYQWQFNTSTSLEVHFSHLDDEELVFQVPSKEYRMHELLGPKPVTVRIARGNTGAIKRVVTIAPNIIPDLVSYYDSQFIADLRSSAAAANLHLTTSPAVYTNPSLPLNKPASAGQEKQKLEPTPLLEASIPYAPKIASYSTLNQLFNLNAVEVSRLKTALSVSASFVLLAIYWVPTLSPEQCTQVVEESLQVYNQPNTLIKSVSLLLPVAKLLGKLLLLLVRLVGLSF